MLITNDISDARLTDVLLHGGVAIIRTDTLYGIVASANNHNAVERVYDIKGRDDNKSCIILLSTAAESYGHQDQLENARRSIDTQNPTSIIIDAEVAPDYLLRENDQLAYRIPHDTALRQLLARTGPLVAPSANPQSLPPARTIDQAVAYFGDKVDIYVDGGEVPADMQPSHIIRVHQDGSRERLR